MKDVFRVINELAAEKIIDRYAIGGAIAAHFYVEAFATFDIDIFFTVAASTSTLFSLEPIYAALRSKGYYPKNEMVQIEGWDVQFLPTFDGLTEIAVENSITFDVEDVEVKVMSPEHLAAIALKTGRVKDFARVKMFLEGTSIDRTLLDSLVEQFGLEEQWQKYKRTV